MSGKLPWRKSVIFFAALLLILTVTVGGTLAILIASSDPVVNLFHPSSVQCSLVEANGSYAVANTGTAEAYVRIAVVANWTKNGAVYGLVPITADDYAISGAGWQLWDGCYVYECAIPPGASSLPLTVQQLGRAPDGCVFSVEVLTEAIQSQPEAAVREAWGFVPGS